MTCSEVKSLLNAYVDRELDVAHTLNIEQHIHECPGCSRAVGQLRALSQATQQGLEYHRAPAGLEQRIRLAAQQDVPRQDAQRQDAQRPDTQRPDAPRQNALREELAHLPRQYPRSWLAIAAILLVAIGLALTVLPYLQGRAANRLLAEEVVAGHIRSLMADHLTDVPSSDQHTVKPWFDGRTDFAPPVADFAGKGFPLVGGRLDYIQHRPVAALVYHYRKHPINLFVWPSDRGTPTPAAALSRDGYNVIHWNQHGMTYWAVSDANEQTLQAFADAIRGGDAPATRP
jgi:anti-sigma factor RsiW